MSWIKSESGDLINLDKAAFIDVLAVDVIDIDDPTHAVFVRMDVWDQEEEGDNVLIQISLFSGDEVACEAFREKLFAKLPGVRL